MSYTKSILLNNKISFVIGGLGLIGLETSKALAECNSKVVILDIDRKKSQKKIANLKLKNKIIYEYFDVSNLIDIENNINNLIKKYNCPDILVNCSFPYNKDYKYSNFKNINVQSLKSNIESLLTSTCWVSLITAKIMHKHKKKGSIINFGSIYGIVGQNLNIYKNTNIKENITYSIAKGGIINMTRQMSSYYGKKNIRINTLSPGGVEGPVAAQHDKQDLNFLKNYSQQSPIGRLAKKNEIAKAVLFLASDLSSYVNGANLIVDGGWTAI